MSNPPRKQFTKPLDVPLEHRIDALLQEHLGATPADVAREAVLAETGNEALEHFKKGDIPYHTRCGAPASWLVRGAWSVPGSFSFGVHCNKCLRDLMTGEISYAPYSE